MTYMNRDIYYIQEAGRLDEYEYLQKLLLELKKKAGSGYVDIEDIIEDIFDNELKKE